jgi:hypothetical protein
VAPWESFTADLQVIRGTRRVSSHCGPFRRFQVSSLASTIGLLLALCSVKSARSQQPTAPSALTVVDGYLAAYNAHDSPGLRRWLADTVFLGGIPAGPTDERLIPDTLIGRLQRAFGSFPDLRARLIGRVVEGSYVVDRYEITIGKKTEVELFSYRVEAGRITGMWEFRGGPAAPAK